MVPDHLIEELTWACHESLAHPGAYKCYLTLREDFIWTNKMCIRDRVYLVNEYAAEQKSVYIVTTDSLIDVYKRQHCIITPEDWRPQEEMV